MSARLVRLSRRKLLTDLGAGGLGVIVLAACAGSDNSDSAAAPTDPASTEPAPDTAADAEPASSAAPSSTAPSTDTTPSSGDAPVSSEPAGDGELQLEHVSLGFVSAYVLVRGNEAAIVDTGQSDSRDAIFEALDALSVGPSAVRDIVLTHNHGDHIGGLSGLEADLTGATVHAAAPDIDSVQTSLTLTQVADGDEVFGMGVVATPGHTPGSISLFDTSTGILVAGDAVNGDGSGGLTGPNPDFSSDMDAANASVAVMAELMPTLVAFGHGGPPVTDDASAKLSALL